MGVLVGGKAGGTGQRPIIYGALQVSSSLKDINVPIFWGQRRLGTNVIWYNDFQKHKVSAKGGKGLGGKGGQQYDYTAAVELAISRGTIESILNCWPSGSTTSVTTLSALGFTLFSGAASQAPPSFVTTKFPTQARNYNNTAYLFHEKLDLGQSASIPDNAFECVRSNGFYTHTSDGYKDVNGNITPAIDCLFSDIIPDYLTNAVYGLGFVSGDIGDLGPLETYHKAQGLFFSPCLKTQETATTTFDRWSQLGNFWSFWSGTQFVFVPLGDTEITGNGVTYTPDNTPAYDLGPGDFLDKDAPVKPSIMDPSDIMNRTALTITDRTIGYTSNPLEWKDDTLVNQYGLRDNASVQGDEICDPVVGRIVVQLIGKRMTYIQRTYTFKTSYRFILCLPGTILTLTEPNLSLNKFPVRVKEIEEDDDGSLTFTCEEFPGSIGTFTNSTSNADAVDQNNPDQNADPGDANPPAVIEPDSAYTQGKATLTISASGASPNWGGCFVWIGWSPTGNMTQIGTIFAPAIQGALTAALPSHVDPDTVNTLSIDATESRSEPQAGITHDDADQLRTLSLVCQQPTLVAGIYELDATGELLAFGDVASTGTYTADLTYLRRGKYGTVPALHAIGDMFTVIDILGLSESSVNYTLPPQYIGQPIYVKLVSFNAFQNSPQDISSVAMYSYVPTGAGFGGGSGGVPEVPVGLATAPGAGQIVVNWTANLASDNVTSYTLYAAPGLSQPFGSAVQIYSGLGTTFTHSGIGNSASFTYFIVATNAVGSSSPSTGVNGTSTSTGMASGANPTATASDTAVNGTALTFMRSDAAPAVQKATTGQFGLVKPDGSTITISGGVISAVGGGGGSGYPPGTPPSVVQSCFATSAISATFATGPTNGNWMVAMTFNSANNAAGTGWTKVTEQSTGTDWGDIFIKKAGASEPTTQQPLSTTTVNGGVIIWELSGANATNPFVTGLSQAEQSGTNNTPILLPNVFNCIGLSAVSLITGATITGGFNAGTQDVLNNTGNRHLFAGHTDLSKTPMVGVMANFSTTGSSKGCTCLITS